MNFTFPKDFPSFNIDGRDNALNISQKCHMSVILPCDLELVKVTETAQQNFPLHQTH